MCRKSLLLAWFLNVVPGLGLIYVGKTGFGVLMIILGVIFLVLCLTGIGAVVGVPLLMICSLIACIASVIIGSKYNQSIGA